MTLETIFQRCSHLIAPVIVSTGLAGCATQNVTKEYTDDRCVTWTEHVAGTIQPDEYTIPIIGFRTSSSTPQKFSDSCATGKNAASVVMTGSRPGRLMYSGAQIAQKFIKDREAEIIAGERVGFNKAVLSTFYREILPFTRDDINFWADPQNLVHPSSCRLEYKESTSKEVTKNVRSLVCN